MLVQLDLGIRDALDDQSEFWYSVEHHCMHSKVVCHQDNRRPGDGFSQEKTCRTRRICSQLAIRQTSNKYARSFVKVVFDNLSHC